MDYIVRDVGKEQWDDYADRHARAASYHLYKWGESLAATYDLPIFRLALLSETTARICGTVSLVLFDPPGRERRLISLPYTDAAGILTDTDTGGRMLLEASLKLMQECGAAHLEIRQAGSAPFLHTRGDAKWSHIAYDFKTGLRRRLKPSAHDLWSNLSAKVRNQVRKARRCGCIVKSGGEELLTDFYSVFSENMRDLGSPVHDQRLFERLMDHSPKNTEIIIVYLQDRAAAGAFVLKHRETLFNPWSSSLRRFRASCANMLLYWRMLEYAVNNNCRWFDFGRSTPGAPTCRFKCQWGAEREALNWHVYSKDRADWDPRSESLSLEDWKTFDLENANREGPAVRRWISL